MASAFTGYVRTVVTAAAEPQRTPHMTHIKYMPGMVFICCVPTAHRASFRKQNEQKRITPIFAAGICNSNGRRCCCCGSHFGLLYANLVCVWLGTTRRTEILVCQTHVCCMHYTCDEGIAAGGAPHWEGGSKTYLVHFDKGFSVMLPTHPGG